MITRPDYFRPNRDPPSSHSTGWCAWDASLMCSEWVRAVWQIICALLGGKMMLTMLTNDAHRHKSKVTECALCNSAVQTIFGTLCSRTMWNLAMQIYHLICALVHPPPPIPPLNEHPPRRLPTKIWPGILKQGPTRWSRSTTKTFRSTSTAVITEYRSQNSTDLKVL